jgi:hypothetical protein
MLDAKMLGHKLMLCGYIVEERDLGERFDVGIGWRSRLAVSKQCCNDNEICLGVQYMVFSNEPFVVGNYFDLLAGSLEGDALLTARVP